MQKYLRFSLLLFALHAHASVRLVEMNGGNLPEGLHYLPHALVQIHLLGSNPMRDGRRWSPGPHAHGTGWHVGDGLLLSVGHLLSQYNGVGQEIPYEPVGEVSFSARFLWGQTNLSAIQLYEDRKRYAAEQGYREGPPGEFYRDFPITDAFIHYAVSGLETGNRKDFALLQLPKPWRETRIPLARPEEKVEVGDSVLMLGYPGASSPREPSGLHAYEGKIVRFDKETGWYVIDRAVGRGVSGGPVIHLKSGKAIAISTAVGTLRGAQTKPETLYLFARDLHHLKAPEMIEVGRCIGQLMHP